MMILNDIRKLIAAVVLTALGLLLWAAGLLTLIVVTFTLWLFVF